MKSGMSRYSEEGRLCKGSNQLGRTIDTFLCKDSIKWKGGGVTELGIRWD